MKIVIANAVHKLYAKVICETIEESAKVRGTGIARRTPEYILTKIENGNAIIALDGQKFAGFCYIEVWGHEKFVANSGLIVHPDYRNRGLAKEIKKAVFEHSRKKYPEAKIFGITTGLAVMKINYELGYQPVTFSELTDDESFWKGCQTCKNYDILTRTERKMCLCTGMLYDPSKEKKIKKKSRLSGKSFKRPKGLHQSLFNKIRVEDHSQKEVRREFLAKEKVNLFLSQKKQPPLFNLKEKHSEDTEQARSKKEADNNTQPNEKPK